jgi:hypothetical protein
MILKYFLAWFPMVLIGILNGVFRQAGYARFMGELTAHQVSTFTGVALVGLYVWFTASRWPIESAGQALLIGGMWLTLTVGFEFLFGHFVMGHSWSRLFHDYNLLKGRLWSLFLIWVAVSPCVFFKILGRR